MFIIKFSFLRKLNGGIKWQENEEEQKKVLDQEADQGQDLDQEVREEDNSLTWRRKFSTLLFFTLKIYQ